MRSTVFSHVIYKLSVATYLVGFADLYPVTVVSYRMVLAFKAYWSPYTWITYANNQTCMYTYWINRYLKRIGSRTLE